MNQVKFTSIFLVTLFTISFELAAFAADSETLVKQCAMCHGKDGNSKSSSIPSFGGSSEKYFKYAIDAYKNGGRKSDMMKRFVDNLSAEDVNKLATYYSQQEYKPAEQEFDPQLADKGQELHNTYCAKCHDNNGRVDPHNYGVLAGQWMPYLKLSIKEYLEGARRVNPMMVKKLKRVQSEVGEEGFEQLVHFYASVK
jgi:sulfide dehydrogenase cytochrome subunit